MRSYIFILLFTLISNILFSQEITGLWLVEQVKIGEETMTPQARWMRFLEDGSQTSGNGWTQHSIGTYNFDSITHQLSIVNTNGLTDPFEAFSVVFEDGKMKWNRIEEGQEVQVFLSKIKQLPQFGRDEILGAWEKTDTKSEKMLFRWDQIFVKSHANGEKEYGVYKVHAHKPEIELIYYGDKCKRTYYNYHFRNHSLNLKNIKDEKSPSIELKRTFSFP